LKVLRDYEDSVLFTTSELNLNKYHYDHDSGDDDDSEDDDDVDNNDDNTNKHNYEFISDKCIWCSVVTEIKRPHIVNRYQ
jgi:hypothetical protein